MRSRLQSAIFLIALLMAPMSTRCQYQPFAVNWLSKASTAKAGREGLGIYGTSGTNYVAGSNVLFTMLSPYTYLISSSGGGGSITTNNYYYTTNFYTTNLYSITTNVYTITTNNYTTNLYSITTNTYTTNLYTITTNTYTTNIYSLVQTNIYATNLLGIVAGTNISFSTNGQSLVINSTAITNPPVGQTPWLQDENAANFSLFNVAGITASSISLTNTGTGSPFLTLNTIGNKGNLLLKDGNNSSSLANSYASAQAPEWDYAVGGVVKFEVGYDGGATRGMVFNTVGTDGLFVFDNGQVAIGNGDTATPTAQALLVDQPNWKITTLAGVSNVFNGKTFGPGGFIGNLIGNVTTATNWPGSNLVWNLNGNNVTSTNFLGSTNNAAMAIKMNGSQVVLLNTNFSVAIGAGANASGVQSIAGGTNSVASGLASIAIGTGATATNSGSVSIGTGAKCYQIQAVAIGNVSASGQYSVCIGNSSTASGIGSVVLGQGNIASGSQAFAAGNAALAIGNNSIAMGQDVQAQYNGSFVISDDQGQENFDSAPDQFIATYAGGFYLYDSAGNTVTINGGVLTASKYNHYRAGNVAVPALATSKSITFSSALASASYVPTVTVGFSLGSLSMYVDTLTASGFTVHFSGAVVGGGTLYYTATLNQ